MVGVSNDAMGLEGRVRGITPTSLLHGKGGWLIPDMGTFPEGSLRAVGRAETRAKALHFQTECIHYLLWCKNVSPKLKPRAPILSCFCVTSLDPLA